MQLSEQVRANLRSLVATHAAMIEMLQQSIDALEGEMETDGAANRIPSRVASVQIDLGLFSIVHRDQQCFLGNTLAFRFLRKLLLHPDRCISHDDLQRDVWRGPRDRSSIRSVVAELRQKLRLAGLAGIADAIDGRVPGHYRLISDRLK